MAVSNDLSNDRRVARHAGALQQAGCEVVVVGRRLPSSPEVEAPWRLVRMPLRHRRGWRFYAELNRRLCSTMLRERPDVVWANDTDTLAGCAVAARRLGCRLVMDAHELFPEVPEVQHRPLVQWVWRAIERRYMPRCDARLTVCQSIADYYRDRYGLAMTVVRNLPALRSPLSAPHSPLSALRSPLSAPHSPLSAPHSPLSTLRSPLSTLLYQGAVNLGRGVDWAIDALEYLPQCRLVVAGRGDLLQAMQTYAAAKPWADRVHFLGHVPPADLDALTRQADVGLVMLDDLGLSYHYALPNRIGDFVAAGVPMVVSDLPEMAAVVRRFGVGEVIERQPGSEARALARAVERVLARQWTDADFAAARRDMDWEREKQKLLAILITQKQTTQK